MKKYLLVVILLSSQIFAQYTTPNTSVNWNLDDLVTNSGGVVTGTFPNYFINQKITVSANDQVNVLAGSFVTFTSSTGQFDVNGIFKAIGTSGDSIIFTSTTQDSTGFYYGFSFNASPNDTASIISYSRIYYADYGMRCINASPTMSNCYLYKCGRGFNLSGSNMKIINNVIERCYEYGITMTLGSSPLIEGNELINNNSQNTGPKNQISIGTQGDNSPIIRYNLIHGGMFNRTGGISVSTLISGSASSSEIAYNEIFNNSYGISFTGTNPINCYVHNNLIYNNNINPDLLTSGSGININGTSVNQPIITQNEIYGNWWGVTIQNGTTVQAGPNPNLGNIENADTTDDGMNIICGNVQGTDTFDVYNNCTNDVFAQNNDWHVYDSTSIEQHVFHKVDDVTHGLIKFIPFSNQIPVELTSFAANIVDGNIILKWTTATELNNSGFSIERKHVFSQQSSVGKEEWNKLAFINGNGTTTEKSFYSFVDQDPEQGKSYYRLKQIDFDGSFEYSNIVEVDFNLPIEFFLEQNYPNPFNPTTKIRYTVPIDEKRKAQDVSLKVYDILGNEVATLVNEEKPAGNYEINFDASNLSSGVYLYKLQASSFFTIKKMILIR